MSDFKRVLLATDLSAASRGAEGAAVSLARAIGAQVLVLHVVDLPPGLDEGVVVRPDPHGPTVHLGDYVSAKDAEALERVVALFRAAAVPVTAAVKVGPVAQTVIEQARRWAAELVVVGTHGRTGLRRAVLGSIAERLLRLSPVPVLVVRQEAADETAEADEQARCETEG